MTNSLISEYIDRYARGIITEEEKIQLASLFRDPLNREAVLQALDGDWAFWEQLDLELPETYAKIRSSVLEKISAPANAVVPVRNLKRKRFRLIAAAVLVLVCVNAYFLLNRKEEAALQTVTATESPILPGKDGAILTLANGKQINLDTIQNARIPLENGVEARIVDGTLVYEGQGREVVYNTMSTPKGRQYQLTLPDGTRVWLNAASSIRYPTVFTGLNRKIEMEGEAYFEVAKTPKPFIVAADQRAEITVLGTHFNVNSYRNEESLLTTVLEGAVQVNRNADRKTITAGQQASATENIRVIDKVNTSRVVAWKNGFFDFEGVSLKEVMKQLERWYDIDVVYSEDVPNITFWGGMTRDITLNDLLSGLKESGVNFKLEGRKLIVLP